MNIRQATRLSLVLLAVTALSPGLARAQAFGGSTNEQGKANQAAAVMRGLVVDARANGGGLRFIKEVSVEKDFLGRTRLKLLAERPANRKQRDKFELAVDWQFTCDSSWSCDPEERPMMRFRIGYRIVYEDKKEGSFLTRCKGPAAR